MSAEMNGAIDEPMDEDSPLPVVSKPPTLADVSERSNDGHQNDKDSNHEDYEESLDGEVVNSSSESEDVDAHKDINNDEHIEDGIDDNRRNEDSVDGHRQNDESVDGQRNDKVDLHNDDSVDGEHHNEDSVGERNDQNRVDGQQHSDNVDGHNNDDSVDGQHNEDSVSPSLTTDNEQSSPHREENHKSSEEATGDVEMKEETERAIPELLTDGIKPKSDKDEEDSGTEDEDDSDDSSQDDSNDDSSKDDSDNSDAAKAALDEEPVSIHSDSESSQKGPEKSTATKNGTQSPEIHEIELSDDDDDQVESGPHVKETAAPETDKEKKDEKPKGTPKKDTPVPVATRRSSRVTIRKSYADIEGKNDKESDVEEVSCEDPLNQSRPTMPKNKPIIVNDTKKLMEMAAKSQKSMPNSKSKEPTMVIIDTNSILSGKGPIPIQSLKPSLPSSMQNSANLYQSIAARGTTVTPVSSKPIANATQYLGSTIIQPAQAPTPILPYLTDDMFVVEAPSFIVPYVYEKPSTKPFRDFVDTLGKQLDEEQKKADEEKAQKEKEEKERREKERRERGEPEEVEKKEKDDSVQEIADDEMGGGDDSAKKKKSEKKARRRRNADDDDASWDGESSSDSDDEALSDDDPSRPKTVVIKDKEDETALDAIKTSPSVVDTPKTPGLKSDSYFDNSLGKFFMGISVNLVQEYVQNDLLKQQKRKLQKENRSGSANVKGTELAIASLLKNIEFSKNSNAPYKFELKKCEFCSFKTDSLLVMAHHMETPHMKHDVYKCNFCPYEIKSPHDILYHMEAEHNIRGRLERAPAYHQCPNCPFEDNGKGKFARHIISCAKKFKEDANLAPPLDWEPPAKIPKLTRARHGGLAAYQQHAVQNAMGNRAPAPLAGATIAGVPPPSVQGPRARARAPAPAPLVRSGLPSRPAPTLLLPGNEPTAIQQKSAGGSAGVAPGTLPPSISITRLPRGAPAPATAPAPSRGTFVICEICDGYIKDLEQLRNHMQWIHKVKIHPKMIYNRPPLNCQKCQFRFFTDQGLERHLLGSHGLVTSCMQEAANKGKDAGRCPVCGRVYQWKLLNHVARDHNLTLKPAHLSYKCTVCTATFGMYKLFENHVYSAHSAVTKKTTDKPKPAGPSSASRQIKINDEITIIP